MRSTPSPARPAAAASGSPVLALTILDRAIEGAAASPDGDRILLAVRDPATNATHPNVISVPTQRIPAVLFEAILQDGRAAARWETTTFYEREDRSPHLERGHDPLTYAVRSILAGKLGAADALETGRLRFTARLAAMMTGRSVYPAGAGRTRSESIRLANAVVTVGEGAGQFPERTVAYSSIRWADARRFLETARQKNPLLLGMDPVAYCIHGLCIATAYNLLAREYGL